MSAGTGIEWATDTWNFLSGCSKVSRGCKNCYAARLAATRLAHTAKYEGLASVKPGNAPRWSGQVRVHSDSFALPLQWQPGPFRPRRIFVNSMSDLFHPKVRNEVILEAFTIMRATPWHRYLILTKRPKRLREFMSELAWRDCPSGDALVLTNHRMKIYNRAILDPGADHSPPPNVAVGVSAEDQKALDSRMYDLRNTPAAFRFLSLEPLVGPIYNLRPAFGGLYPVDWVIVGGESGPDALVASMDMEWVAAIRAECKLMKAGYFYKQPGQRPTLNGKPISREAWSRDSLERSLNRESVAAHIGELPPFFEYPGEA